MYNQIVIKNNNFKNRIMILMTLYINIIIILTNKIIIVNYNKKSKSESSQL